MAKKWAISNQPPLKVRLVKETEQTDWGDAIDRPNRIRTIGRRIVKVLLLLWALCVSSWLQACHQDMSADSGAQDAIDRQSNPFNDMV